MHMDNNRDNKVVKTTKSPVPFYLVAALWLIWALFFPMYKAVHYVILAALSLIVYFSGKRLFKPKIEYIVVEPSTGDDTVDALLKTGRDHLENLQKLRLSTSGNVFRRTKRLEQISQSIFSIVSETPSKAPKVRRFINYYLPATTKLIETHIEMTRHGVEGENITATVQNIETTMDTLVKIFEKQLDLLYSGEALDISTDIDVLDSIFSKEGLNDSDFK